MSCDSGKKLFANFDVHPPPSPLRVSPVSYAPSARESVATLPLNSVADVDDNEDDDANLDGPITLQRLSTAASHQLDIFPLSE